MSSKRLITEQELAAFAKTSRERACVSRAQAARDMKVAQVSIFRAEENPEESLLKLRMRMIEKYSHYKIKGPLFQLAPK
jgi:hypothetical protein